MSITIENCSTVGIKNGIINIRGTILFQASLKDAHLIRYLEPSRTLQLMFTNGVVETVMPANTTTQFLATTLPSYFYQIYETPVFIAVNMKLISFLHTDGIGKIVIHFFNGTPGTINLGQNVIEYFVKICEMVEYIRQ